VLWGYAAEELLIAMRPDVLFRTPQDIIEHVAARR
jgi:phosphoglycolate phosphatase